MSLRSVVSSQEMDTKLTGDTASVQLIDTWCLAYFQCSAIQSPRSLQANDNKLDWEHNANLVIYNTKCNSQTNQILVICFALSGTPPWNNHQSQRLPNVSKRDITEPRWPERISFLTTWTAVPLSATPYRLIRDLFWKRKLTPYTSFYLTAKLMLFLSRQDPAMLAVYRGKSWSFLSCLETK